MLNESRTITDYSPVRKLDTSIRSVYKSPVRHGKAYLEDYPWTYSPMRGYEESELVENLKELIDYEWNLENKKENLAAWPDFNLTDCFWLFDFTGTGLISVSDL